MTSLQKEDSLFGEKNNKRLLMKSIVDCKKTPVLHLPDEQGQFELYSDTSKFATGSVLYQTSDWTAKAHCLCK